MYLAISRREKIFGGTKRSRGGKKAIRGRQKIVSTFFFRHLSFCRGGGGGRQKNQQGGVKW